MTATATHKQQHHKHDLATDISVLNREQLAQLIEQSIAKAFAAGKAAAGGKVAMHKPAAAEKANVIHLKAGSAHKEGERWVNEFGYQLWVPKTLANMQARARVLRQGIADKRWKGDLLARAEEHLYRTEAAIERLKEAESGSKRKPAKRAKAR